MPRPKAYDPAAALDRAMQLFWTEGFEAASIPKLEKHLGINRFSIYDSFGSKRNLFLRALDSYTGMLIESLVAPLEAGTAGLGDLDRFLSRLARLFADQTPPRGCLLCNTAIELGTRDQDVALRVKSYFERVESAVFACLLRARDLGETEGDRAVLRDRARLARWCMQGLLTDLRLAYEVPQVGRTLTAWQALFAGKS